MVCCGDHVEESLNCGKTPRRTTGSAIFAAPHSSCLDLLPIQIDSGQSHLIDVSRSFCLRQVILRTVSKMHSSVKLCRGFTESILPLSTCPDHLFSDDCYQALVLLQATKLSAHVLNYKLGHDVECHTFVTFLQISAPLPYGVSLEALET